MKTKIFVLIALISTTFVLFTTVGSCSSEGPKLPLVEGIAIAYTESTEDFPNPERGFYRYWETSTSDFDPLDAETIRSYRSVHKISSSNYSLVSTLLFRYYILDNFRNAPISADILQALEVDMEAVRSAGSKIIPRFVYTVTAHEGDCPEGFICPPYGDAPKSVILNHISQLTPFFRNNADVIACVQMGFIGTWGEQYYSDYFGDPSNNADQDNKLSNLNWQDRLDILKALLDAVPEDRMVQVRYPQMKQRFVYGVESPLDSAPLLEAEAFSHTDKARIGLHNDCFLSGSNDIGTYEDYGNDDTPRSSNAAVVSNLRNYMREEGRFVVIGGETCSDAFSPQNDCAPAGFAQQEFADMKYSYLNAHYNNEVNNDWQDGGCMDEIKRNLGYRFVLEKVLFPSIAIRGTDAKITFNVINRGYASPFNERPLILILRNADNRSETVIPIESTDVRRWERGSITFTAEIRIPNDMPIGQYELFLNLPDPYESLADNPDYSIRFANEDMWEESTGYNKLNYTLKVN